MAVSGCEYQADGTSKSNGSGTAKIVLGWSATALSAPTGCTPTISTTPTTLTSAGGTANLNVTGCSVPSGTITYAWFRNGAQTSSSQSWSDTLPSNSGTSSVTTSYQVQACNGSACTASLPAAPLTATVPGSGPGAGGGTNLCAAQGFTKTIYTTWDWAKGNLTLDTWAMKDQAGGTGIGPNGILVVAFTPTQPADIDNLAKIAATEYPGNSLVVERTLALSSTPCDLNPPYPGTSTSTAPSVSYGVGTVTNSFFSGKPKGVALTPGVQYYVNVAGRNSVTSTSPSGTQTCFPSGSSVCDVRVSLSKPSGH